MAWSFVSLDTQSRYTPRGENAQAAQGINGAIEHLSKIKYNGEEPDPVRLLEIQEEVNAFPSSSRALGIQWENIGPDNIGGRTRALMYDRNDANVVYAAGVSGGLFRSPDGGNTWSKVPGQIGTEIITSITQTANGDIYVGSGEMHFLLVPLTFGGIRTSGFIGNGIWKTSDNGNSFTQVLAPSATNTTNAQYIGVYRLASVGNTVYAATSSGVVYTTDGGTNWAPIVGTPAITATVSKDVKAHSDGTVVAVNGNAVYVTTNGPTNFERVSSNPGFVTGVSNRVEVAIAPSNSNVLYAATSTSNNDLGVVLRSGDKGQTWTNIGSGGSTQFNPLSNSQYGQGNYNLALAVFPDNEDRIVLGGVQLWDWKVGTGGGWTRIGSEFQSPFNPWYVHADKHAFTFHPNYGVDGNQTMLIGSDGGVGRSFDGGQTFDVANRGFNVTQVYALSISPRLSGSVLAGTQDNGTFITPLTGPQPYTAADIFGGDGMYTAWSQNDPDIIFVSTQSGFVFPSNDGGETFVNYSTFYSPRMLTSTGDPNTNYFYTVFELWEGAGANPQSAFLMGLSNSVWMTRHALDFQGTPEWFRVAAVTGDPQCFAISKDGDVAYVGTQGGGLWRIGNLSTAQDSATGDVDSPSRQVTVTNLTSQLAANGAVTSVAIHPSNKNKVVVTIGYYGGSSSINIKSCDNTAAASPSFVTKQGNLPRMPVYTAIFEEGNPNRVIVGTEFGCWATENINNTGSNLVWEDANSGMDKVPVFQLRQKIRNIDGTADGRIYAGTHGRGVYRTSNFVSVDENEVSGKQNLNVYPNPATNFTTIGIELKGPLDYIVELVDMNGATIRMLGSNQGRAGVNTLNLDLTGVASGTYLVRVRGEGLMSYGKLVVSK
jgi:photosystem II stability/assembly factor-like uncharacterized protein